MIDGAVSANQRRQLEEHIDGCADCRRLLAELGRVYSPSLHAERFESAALQATVLADVRPAGSARQLVALELTMLTVHVLWTALLLPLAWRGLFLPGDPVEWAGRSVQDSPGPLSIIGMLTILSYTVIWAPLGTLWTALAAYGLSRHRGWAPAAAKVHALVSLPSGLLLPLGVMVLVELRRGPTR
jgi:anti-sigma factor RsiW